MKLTLCVPLIWMLFSSAEALKCVQDSRGSDLQPCDSNEQCLSAARRLITDNGLDVKMNLRTCTPSSLCNEGDQSVSLAYNNTRWTVSLQCCSTDGCNNKSIPFPDKQKPNGLQCFTCPISDPSCNRTQQCVGSEDRCMVVYRTGQNRTYPFHGCASANLCEGQTELKLSALLLNKVQDSERSFSAPECCETSLCNSAPADKLSVISLLLALVALSVC